MPDNKTIMQTIKANPLPWIVQATGILLFVGNLYLASLLWPIIRDIDKLTGQVVAIESSLFGRAELVQEFRVVQEQLVHVRETQTEIKQDLRDVKNFLNIR